MKLGFATPGANGFGLDAPAGITQMQSRT